MSPSAYKNSLLLFVCLLLGETVFTVESIAAARPPNILFLLADDQRPDTIHALGNSRIRTPNLDKLAGQGTAFTRMTVGCPICMVSRAEILTGRPSFKNGVLYGRGKFMADNAYLPKVLAAAGYHTWYVGKWHTQGKPHDMGYEETRGLFSGGGGGKAAKLPHYDHKGQLVTGYTGWTFKRDDGTPEPERGIGLTPDISSAFADAAIEFIERKPGRPFFLHVNFTAPHDPLLRPPAYEKAYRPDEMLVPANFQSQHPFDHGNFYGRDEKLLPWPRTREAVQLEISVYYAVISHLDEQVGRILDSLRKTGQDRNTLIVYSSDHGLAMGSHGLMGKQNMYEHTINVPFLMRGPGVPVGKRLDAQACLRDLFPTFCEVAGVATPATVEGHSLWPVLRGETKTLRPFITGYFTDTQRMIRYDGWKLSYYLKLNRYQLFNLNQDPFELHDLSAVASEQPRLHRMRVRMEEWFRSQGDPDFPPVH